jgi:hypothetical protein
LVPHAARASVAIGHRRSPSAQSRGQRPQFAAIEFAAPGVSIPHYGWLPASRSAVSSFFTREMSLILSVEVRRDLDTHRGGRIHGQTTSRDGRSRQPSGWSAGQPRSWMRASLARSRRRPAGPCGCSQVMALTSLQNAPLGRRLESKRLPNAARASVRNWPRWFGVRIRRITSETARALEPIGSGVETSGSRRWTWAVAGLRR